MAKIKEIGVVENHYHILQKNVGNYVVEFRVGTHTIGITNFEWYERMSEETNAFCADLILDGIKVGECSNEGRGGCASYHAFGNWELAQEIEQVINELENYCFPSMKLNLCDVIDNIASLMVCFKANNITKLSDANKLVNYLQKQSEKYRNINSERMARIIEKAKEEQAKEEQAKAVDTTPSIITKYGREWEISTKKYDVGNDLDWWFVAEFAEGVLHMNNVIGVMLFIERNGTELETSI